MNLRSQSNIIFTSALCCINISFIYTSDKFFADISSIYSIKYPHLVALSTITNILLYSCPITGSFDFSNLTMKSHEITSHGPLGVLTGYNIPYSLCLTGLFLWQSGHSPMTFLAIFQILWIIYSSCNLATNTMALLCPYIRFL